MAYLHIAVCDLCGKELPVFALKINGIEVDRVVKTYRTEVWDTYPLFDMLCETCALKLDKAFLQLRGDILSGLLSGGKKHGMDQSQ